MLGESGKPGARVIDQESLKQITSSMKHRANVKRIHVKGWIPEVFAVWHKPSRSWISRDLQVSQFPQLMNREEASLTLDQVRARAAQKDWCLNWGTSCQDVFEYDIMTWHLPKGL